MLKTELEIELEKGLFRMDSFEWEVFKRTGKVDHYLLWKEAEPVGASTYPSLNSGRFKD